MTIERPMFPPIDPTRRRFLSNAAGVAAGGTALALATITPGPSTAAPATPLDASKASHPPEVSNPDAEIVAAGMAFEPLLSRYLDARFICPTSATKKSSTRLRLMF